MSKPMTHILAVYFYSIFCSMFQWPCAICSQPSYLLHSYAARSVLFKVSGYRYFTLWFVQCDFLQRNIPGMVKGFFFNFEKVLLQLIVPSFRYIC